MSIPSTLLLLVMVASSRAQIAWNGNWAMGCDFKGNDLSNARVRGEDCSSKCQSTPGCTHFTWSNYNGGTCWMKKGAVSKSDAFASSNQGKVCGIVANSSGQVKWNGNWAYACAFKGRDLGELTVCWRIEDFLKLILTQFQLMPRQVLRNVVQSASKPQDALTSLGPTTTVEPAG